MKEKLALLLGMVLCATMTFSAGGLAWAQPQSTKPEPPKKHRKVCLQWTKVVEWPTEEDPNDPKVQVEKKYYWIKAKKAYAYQAAAPDFWDLPEGFYWKFKVVKKVSKQECLSKNPAKYKKKNLKNFPSLMFRWWRR